MRTVVVPCFNEERRLSRDGVRELAAGTRVLLVDDGSSDGTWALLETLAAEVDGVDALRLERNGGKGEAVRQGLLHALADGADVVGYFDADFATPAAEMLRLLDVLEEDDSHTVVLASRVALLGRQIDRSPSRHYLGRVFATGASLALALPVYDTQCGAKALRRTPALDGALARPLTARWAFDVELLGRLLYGDPRLDPAGLREVPLRRWSDVGGSTLGPAGMARAAGELGRIWLRTRRARGTAYRVRP